VKPDFRKCYRFYSIFAFGRFFSRNFWNFKNFSFGHLKAPSHQQKPGMSAKIGAVLKKDKKKTRVMRKIKTKTFFASLRT